MDWGERAEELVALAEGLREAIARATTSKEEPCIAMSSSNVQSVADRAQSSQNGSPVDHSEEVGRGWGARPGAVVHWAGADHVPRSALALRWPSPPPRL